MPTCRVPNFRPMREGEKPTHYWHMRTHTIFGAEALYDRESGEPEFKRYRGDCMMGLVCEIVTVDVNPSEPEPFALEA